jgi:prenyltransferase beta subunit
MVMVCLAEREGCHTLRTGENMHKDWITMKKVFLSAGLGLLVLSMVACVTHSKNSGKAHEAVTASVDMSKVLEFYQAVAARERFPDSTQFAFYTAYSLRALDGRVPAEVQEKIVTFITACQRSDGGFASHPEFGLDTNIIFTYHALKALDLLESMEAVNGKKAAAYLVSHLNEDGGFRPRRGETRKSTLVASAYGIQALSLLKALDRLDRKKTAAYLMSFKETGSGFAMYKGKGAAIQATAMAIGALQALGPVEKSLRADVVSFLRATRYGGHMEKKKFTTWPTVKSMSEVLETMASLGSLDQLNRKKALEFVESLYIDENGGFGPRLGLGTTPPSTYHAVVCLVHLGKLPDPYTMETPGKK